MHILKLSDGMLGFNPNGHLQLHWAELNLVWYAKDAASFMIDLNQSSPLRPLWEKSGRHHPKDVWGELSIALLEHNIVCEPIDNNTELTHCLV